MTYRIQRFSPLQAAKLMGLMYTILGLVFMPFFLLAAMFGGEAAGFSLMFGLAAPIFYGLIGLVMGAVGSVIYNLLAGWVGGFEIDLAPVPGMDSSPGL